MPDFQEDNVQDAEKKKIGSLLLFGRNYNFDSELYSSEKWD